MSPQRSPDPFAEPVDAAKAASLRYVSDSAPGIRRRRAGSGFSYLSPEGKTIRDAARIRALAIPPAWRDVWICPRAEGHLQATKRDVKDLGGIAGQDFTAKDFRTWAGTLLAARELRGTADPETHKQARSGLASATEAVALALGNTAAICRKCHIHPTVLAAFHNRALHERWRTASARKTARRGLSKEESALLAFLRANSGRSLGNLLRDSLSPPRRGGRARR